MMIVFISNYFNHHQRPLSDALYRRLKGDYCFIETAPMREDRRQLGYGWAETPAYVKTAYRDREQDKLCHQLVLDADVVIAGSAPEEYLCQRIQMGKLVFRYSERPLKQGIEPWKYVPRFIRWHRNNPAGKPVYLLAASAYAAQDYAKFGLFKNRAYKWGYFPETKRFDRLPEKQQNTILWAGRFLDWKHPEDALRAIARLKDDGYLFQLRIIGTGPLEPQLRAMAARLQLQDCVTFLGAMKPEQVRTYMEHSAIMIFSSDRQEGWGAVVNEAMNSGCAVVASQAAGSVPYLIQDGKNGFTYHAGDIDTLTQKVKYLLDHPLERAGIGQAAYHTIADIWNAETAAERLIVLAENLSKGTHYSVSDGPCSPA